MSDDHPGLIGPADFDDWIAWVGTFHKVAPQHKPRRKTKAPNHGGWDGGSMRGNGRMPPKKKEVANG